MIRHKKKTSRSGFLLLEVILAITIVTIGTVAIMRTYTTSLAAGVISQQYMTASNLLDQIIWDKTSLEEIPSGSSSGKFPPPNSIYTWDVTIEEILPDLAPVDELEDFEETSDEPETDVDKPVYILYIVNATVKWTYRKKVKELLYQTAVMRKQPDEFVEEFGEEASEDQNSE